MLPRIYQTSSSLTFSVYCNGNFISVIDIPKCTEFERVLIHGEHVLLKRLVVVYVSDHMASLVSSNTSIVNTNWNNAKPHSFSKNNYIDQM